MPEIKNIIITFDYELFLGSRSGTVENCVLLPTNILIDIFKRYNISKVIFFVDTTYLLKLKNSNAPSAQSDFKKITEQLIELSGQGHYIFPHLHPHWIDSIYLPDINQWDLSETKKYNFTSISAAERSTLFENSIKLLEEICGPQPEWGYRAGGWCIQPFTNFEPFFSKHNITCDFSVMKGYSCNTEFQHFDFRQAPAKNYYNFSSDIIKEDANGKFTEFAISTVRISYLNRVMNKFFTKLLYRKGITNFGDGYSTHSASLKEIKPFGYEMASLELLTMVNINDYLQTINKSDYIQLISHPKMLTHHNLTCFDVLLKKITNKYEINTDFKKIKKQIDQ